MNRLLALTALLLLLPGAQAAPTAIATLPLLNISGTGTVKPNLMLLYDNSGSMKSAFTPDYVDDSTTCRAKDTMATSRGCRIGDPPFASADFNKQYYNPKVRYRPPVDAAGVSFKSMASEDDWKSAPTDAFNVDKVDLQGNGVATTNLLTAFPDLRWCDGNGNCGYNTAGYAYPDATHTTPQYFFANPYYYAINVAEYCTDATLTNCRVTAVGAPAPAGHPVAAPVRWCDSRALTRCQAKYVGNYKYPRFSDPARNPDFYGTITIGASASDSKARISQVEVVTPSGTQVLTNAAVLANNGTNTAAEQAAAANALALSIVAKKNVGEQYTACVRSPTLGGVPACSSFGITLDSNNVVAVVPISCPATATGKGLDQCALLVDGSRAGRTLIVSAATNVTALLSVSGTANNGSNQELAGVTLGGTQLFTSTPLRLGRGASASAVATAIVGRIGTLGAVQAFAGKDTASFACAAASANTVCLVTTALTREGQNIGLGQLTNNTYNNGKSAYLSFSANAAVSDGIPTTVTPLGASVFVRTDIVPGRNSYPRDIARDDCLGATCTYAEEMTNFANWYAYYKTRNQMMKTAVGQAFQQIADNYNVGIVALSVAAAEGAITAPKPFAGTSRSTWYNSLYAMTGTGSTPIRQALHSVGKMYANRSPYNYSAGNEVIQFPCQQNFTFVTTDGYWNGAAAADVINNDDKESVARFCSRAKGCVDTSAQSANSLADVALYWYNGGSNDKASSLRPQLEDWTATSGNVAAGSGENTRLHMKTYALGLGVDGIMTYDKDYEEAKSGTDFNKLVNGVPSGCPWNNNGPWIWPNPLTGDDSGSATYQSRVDDLWHAAINGHGKYFSASDPLQVIDGLGEALLAIKVTQGAAAAAATSTPNISVEDNDIFAATFTTVRWFGELQGRKINVVDGVVAEKAEWSSSNTVGTKVGAATDSRTILMLDVASRSLKNFKFEAMTAGEQAWFAGKCSQLAQCPTLKPAERDTVNNGLHIVNWLRGQQQHADDKVLRAYSKTDVTKGGPAVPLPILLGDIASSKPAYLRDPRKAYPEKEYLDFKQANLGRKATVFVGANDGMLHAFDAAQGAEIWAYAPRITMKKLYKQSGTTYAGSHQFTVDGSPEVADVKIGGQWRSVLVAGLNSGGRGYYALDVTDPAAPTALWELCADAAVCSGINYDADIGLTFGNPQFGTWKDGAGVERWVVFLTSGYNNVKGIDELDNGSGEGYLYVVDVATGAVLSKTGTGRVIETTGGVAKDVTATTPSGLARITAISDNPNTDPLVTFIYGGDNLGRMWRFDFTSKGAPGLLKLGDAGSSRPVTTRPDVTLCRPGGGAATGGETGDLKRVVAFGTGRLLALEDIGNTATQSAYVLVDKGQAITDLRSASTMAQQSLTKVEGTSAYAINGVKIDLASQNGWFMDFNQNPGERVNLDPKIVAGALNIVTNMPSNASSCDVGGTSNVYQVNACTGEPLVAIDIDGTAGKEIMMVAGRTLSNAAAAVGSIVISLPSGELKQITTNADGSMVTTAVAAANSDGASRAGWRRVRD